MDYRGPKVPCPFINLAFHSSHLMQNKFLSCSLLNSPAAQSVVVNLYVTVTLIASGSPCQSPLITPKQAARLLYMCYHHFKFILIDLCQL